MIKKLIAVIKITMRTKTIAMINMILEITHDDDDDDYGGDANCNNSCYKE